MLGLFNKDIFFRHPLLFRQLLETLASASKVHISMAIQETTGGHPVVEEVLMLSLLSTLVGNHTMDF